MESIDRARPVSGPARRALQLGHQLGWGTTRGGKRYALCSCGWRAPQRSKLTHGISDARDHVAAVVRDADAAAIDDTRSTDVVPRRVALARQAGRA